jgi:hypothetical protein
MDTRHQNGPSHHHFSYLLEILEAQNEHPYGMVWGTCHGNPCDVSFEFLKLG